MSHQSFLDADGNVNTTRLCKELQSALAFDAKYKQTDNMKKRAVKVAGSYDEFKAMVACAHLKKLSKEEVKSLSDVKKGWKKRSQQHSDSDSNPNGNSTANFTFLEATANHKDMDIVQETLKSTKPTRYAKTTMELERDLRRIKDDEAKWRYLCDVGAERAHKLLDRGADVDLLEEILRVAVSRSCPSISDASTNESTPSNPDQLLITTWLDMISSLQRFTLMLQFADRGLLERILLFLDAANVEDLRQKYNPTSTTTTLDA